MVINQKCAMIYFIFWNYFGIIVKSIQLQLHTIWEFFAVILLKVVKLWFTVIESQVIDEQGVPSEGVHLYFLTNRNKLSF